MPKSSKLGQLDWITQPGKLDEAKQPDAIKDAKSPSHAKPAYTIKPSDTPKNPEASNIAMLSTLPDEATSLDILENVTFRVPKPIHDRMYAELYYAPRDKTMQDIAAEVIQAGLATRPDKGPAPPEFIALMKSRGKRKKS